MPKKAAPKKSAKTKLPTLTGIQHQVMTHVLNNVAFDNYGDCCSVDDIAEQFQRTPNRFLLTLRKLVEKGYLTIQGKTFPWVYPTVVTLQHQDPTLSEAQAKKILAKIKR
jgi:hypothetical protein